ncbi:MAG: hypothetical protein ACYC6W_10120 [Nitrosotalea sp.]
MENKIVYPILLLGITAILVLSFNPFDSQSRFMVFAQTSDDSNLGPIPEGNYTDPNTGPIPENNFTDPTIVPDPLSNSTNIQNPNPAFENTIQGDNMTGPLEDNMSNSLGNTSVQTSSPAPTNTGNVLPPLEQVKSGIQAKDVQCKQDFTLIIKSEDGSPACVYPQIAQILIQRGW